MMSMQVKEKGETISPCDVTRLTVPCETFSCTLLISSGYKLMSTPQVYFPLSSGARLVILMRMKAAVVLSYKEKRPFVSQTFCFSVRIRGLLLSELQRYFALLCKLCEYSHLKSSVWPSTPVTVWSLTLVRADKINYVSLSCFVSIISA